MDRQVERSFAEIFEREVAVFLVADRDRGERARARASGHRRGARCCATGRRISRSMNAARRNSSAAASSSIGLAGEGSKIAPATLRRRLDGDGAAAHVSPSVLSLSQATGCRHDLSGRRDPELARIAHRHGVAVHVDGARLGNALARMNVSPAEAPGRPASTRFVRRHQGRRDGS